MSCAPLFEWHSIDHKPYAICSFLWTRHERHTKTTPYLPARNIHERFCCNRGFAAATSLDAADPASGQAGSPLGRSTYCVKYASLPRGSRPARGDCAFQKNLR